MPTITLIGTPDPDDPHGPRGEDAASTSVIPPASERPSAAAGAATDVVHGLGVDGRVGGWALGVPAAEAADAGRGPGTAVEPRVFDAEIVTAEQSAALDGRLARQGWVGVAGRAARAVRESERSVAAARVSASVALCVYQGWESWAWRCWDAATMGVYRRQIRAAEAVGNYELLAEWTDRKEKATEARHARMRDLPGLVAGLVRVALGGSAALVVGVVLVAGLVQVSGAGEFTAVLAGVLDAARWVFGAVTLVWTPFLVALPVLVMLGAWREGRRRGAAPSWLATAAEADLDAAIDETTIARALQALRIPQITTYVKQGLPMQYLTPARRDGRGTHAVLRLPSGVTAEKIARRRADLATGLHRLAKEVWPTTGAEAGILDLWVADKGALAEGAGEFPLLGEGLVDVFKGVPFGRTLRGTPVCAPLMERNTLTGGMPGQGKSSAARVLMVGAALDPTAELRIWVPGRVTTTV